MDIGNKCKSQKVISIHKVFVYIFYQLIEQWFSCDYWSDLIWTPNSMPVATLPCTKNAQVEGSLYYLNSRHNFYCHVYLQGTIMTSSISNPSDTGPSIQDEITIHHNIESWNFMKLIILKPPNYPCSNI